MVDQSVSTLAATECSKQQQVLSQTVPGSVPYRSHHFPRLNLLGTLRCTKACVFTGSLDRSVFCQTSISSLIDTCLCFPCCQNTILNAFHNVSWFFDFLFCSIKTICNFNLIIFEFGIFLCSTYKFNI